VVDYVDSFRDHQKNKEMKEMGSTGKSGSIFYFTTDMKYIIKSVADHEMDTILSCVHELCKHTQANPNTLIHYYGAHAIELESDIFSGTRKLMYFVVMKNLLDTSFIPRDLYPYSKQYDNWDLKGALYLRRHVDDEATIAEKHKDKHVKLDAPLDLDWMDLHRRIYARQEQLLEVSKQLKADCDFLGRVNMLDYSLLLGVHDVRRVPPLESGIPREGYIRAPELADEDGPCMIERDGRKVLRPCTLTRHGYLDKDAENLYLLGIIDITERKRIKWMVQAPILRNLLKCLNAGGCVRGADKDPRAITAVEPEEYASRFVEFMEKIVLRSEEDFDEHPDTGYACGIAGREFSLAPHYDLDAADTILQADEFEDLPTHDMHSSGVGRSSEEAEAGQTPQHASKLGPGALSPTASNFGHPATIGLTQRVDSQLNNLVEPSLSAYMDDEHSTVPPESPQETTRRRTVLDMVESHEVLTSERQPTQANLQQAQEMELVADEMEDLADGMDFADSLRTESV